MLWGDVQNTLQRNQNPGTNASPIWFVLLLIAAPGIIIAGFAFYLMALPFRLLGLLINKPKSRTESPTIKTQESNESASCEISNSTDGDPTLWG